MSNFNNKTYSKGSDKINDNFTIFGINPINKVLDKRAKDIKSISFFTKDLNKNLKFIFDKASIEGVKIKYLDLKELKKNNYKSLDLKVKNIVLKQVHQKVIAQISPKRPSNFDSVISNKNINFIFILDGVTDANNLGAIIRNLAAFKVDLLILPKNKSAQIDEVTYKTSAGELENIEFSYVSNLVSTIKILKDRGFWVYGFEEDAKTSIVNYNFSSKLVFILGSEAKGIRDLVLKNCDEVLKIPISDNVQSLNVSSTSAVIAYELFKSRVNNNRN